LAEVDGGTEFERARRTADERALVESAARGSAAAFERLYRDHVGKVYGLCLRMTANSATAEDCTQETFIQAWRSLPRFERRSSFATWLHRIAVNAVLAQGRRRRGPAGEPAPLDEEMAEAIADPSESDAGEVRDLEAAIGALPEGARRVLVLAGLYGYSHEETAAMLGIAVGTCKAQLHRARQLLAQRLGEAEEEA
jgi:RNA polymerase sigma-70 factor (ECF subfamily)